MQDHALPTLDGYDTTSQRTVACLAAALDDQLRRLKESVAELDVEALEWQEAPGRNSIGMLLAHVAVAEAWWMNAATRGIAEREQVDMILEGIIGIPTEGDGMPLAPDGEHPGELAGLELDDYLSLIDRARAATHVTLRSWQDTDLANEVEVRERKITLGWMLYHVLEHFVAHYGQILLLLRIRAGRAPEPS